MKRSKKEPTEEMKYMTACAEKLLYEAKIYKQFLTLSADRNLDIDSVISESILRFQDIADELYSFSGKLREMKTK